MKSKIVAASALLALVLPACSSGGDLEVVLDEYSVSTAADTRRDLVRFDVRNAGQISHELDVLRTNRRADDLPVSDAVVQTKAPDVELVRKTKRIRPGATATLAVQLRLGAYVLVCNVPGHYQSGMRTAFAVR